MARVARDADMHLVARPLDIAHAVPDVPLAESCAEARVAVFLDVDRGRLHGLRSRAEANAASIARAELMHGGIFQISADHNAVRPRLEADGVEQSPYTDQQLVARAVPLGVAADSRGRQRHPGVGWRSLLAEGAADADQHRHADLLHQLALLLKRQAELAYRDSDIGAIDLDSYGAHT